MQDTYDSLISVDMFISKIIIAHLYFPGSAGSNRILAYTQGFRELGLKVILVLAAEKDFEFMPMRDIDVHKCIGRHGNQAKMMADCIKKLYTGKNSVVLTYGTPSLCWYLTKKQYNIFYECTEIPFYGRKKTIKSRLKEKFKSFLARRATGMLVISKSLKDYFCHSGIRNIVIVNMFVDSDRFNHVEVRHGGKYIAYCGWVSESKDGVDILIRAYHKFRERHEDYKLYIVGDFISKNDEVNLLRLVSSLGLTDKVVFTGKVPPSEIPSLLCNAQILALARPNNEQASYGFPTKLGEYLATGKPVVVTRVGEIGDFMRDGVNCRMAEPDNPEAFAECLAWVADNYEEAKKLGEVGRLLTQKEFSNIEQSKKAFAFIQEVSC